MQPKRAEKKKIRKSTAVELTAMAVNIHSKIQFIGRREIIFEKLFGIELFDAVGIWQVVCLLLLHI